MAKLTEKQALFAEEYIKNGYNGTQAYMTAYKQDNKNVAASEAYKLLKTPKIQEELNNVELSFRLVGHGAGLDKKTIMKVIADMLNAKKTVDGEVVADYSIRDKAITQYSKLCGDYTERKKIEFDDSKELGDFDPTKMSDEEREILKDQILKEL